MRVSVRLPPALASQAGGVSRLEYEMADDGATVADVLSALAADHPGVGRRVRDERLEVRRHVNVFVGGDNIRDLDGQATRLADAVEVTILAAVSGG